MSDLKSKDGWICSLNDRFMSCLARTNQNSCGAITINTLILCGPWVKIILSQELILFCTDDFHVLQWKLGSWHTLCASILRQHAIKIK